MQNQEQPLNSNPNGAAPNPVPTPNNEKKPIYKRVWFWVALVPILLIAFSAMSDNDSGSETPNSNASTTESSDQPVNPTVGEIVRVGDVEWTVLNPTEIGTTLQPVVSYGEPKTAQGNGKFVKVTYKVENVGKEMKTTTGVDLQDDQDRQFTSFSDQYMYIPEERRLDILSNLNPNVSQEFDLIYEVPADAKNFKARVGNLQMFSNEVKLVDLGI